MPAKKQTKDERIKELEDDLLIARSDYSSADMALSNFIKEVKYRTDQIVELQTKLKTAEEILETVLRRESSAISSLSNAKEELKRVGSELMITRSELVMANTRIMGLERLIAEGKDEKIRLEGKVEGALEALDRFIEYSR